MVNSISQAKTSQVSELGATINNEQATIANSQVNIPQVLKQFAALCNTNLLPSLPNANTNMANIESGVAKGALAGLAGLSLDSLFSAVGNAERREACQAGLTDIKGKAEERKKVNDKKIAEMQTRFEKMQSQKKLNIFQRIFKAIAKVFMAIATIATLAIGVVTANPLLIVAGGIMAALLIDSIVAEATDGKVSLGAGITKACKAMGLSDKVAGIIAATVIVAIAVTAAVLTFGAGAGGAATSTVKTVVGVASQISAVGSSVTSIAQGATGIAAAAIDYDIAKTLISNKQLDALLEKIRNAIEFEQAIVESKMKEAGELMSKVADVVKSSNEAQAIILGAGNSTPSFA